MSKFKAGDRVVTTGVEASNNGISGFIDKINTTGGYGVILDDRIYSMYFAEDELQSEGAAANDDVNHPSHYTSYKGIEVIQLTEQMNFNRGNSVKYVARAGLKNPETEIQDLEKAKWYLEREIQRLKNLSV